MNETQQNKVRRNLSFEERQSVITFLLSHSVNGKLSRGQIAEAAEAVNCHRNSISAIWKRHNETKTAQNHVGDVSSRITLNSGRIGYNYNELKQKLKELPFQKRRTMRDISVNMNVSTSVVNKMLQLGKIRRHVNRVKPLLTDKNKLSRVEYAMSFIEPKTMMFDKMYNIVHIDEKWFNETSDKKVYYLADDEENPIRNRKSKKIIGKTMFLAAVSRPR